MKTEKIVCVNFDLVDPHFLVRVKFANRIAPNTYMHTKQYLKKVLPPNKKKNLPFFLNIGTEIIT